MGITKVLSKKNLQEVAYPSRVAVYCIGRNILGIPTSNQINELSAFEQNGEPWTCPEEKK